MNVSPVARAHSVLASSSIVRPSCSGRSKTPVPTSWHSQWQAFIPVLFLALAAFPACVSAAPTPLTPGVHIEIDEIHRRNQDSGSQSNTDTNTSQSSDNSISMNVWLPILIVIVVFILFSVITCVRRCAASDAAARNTTPANPASTPASGNTTRPRRRPRRTPSQISTKSLPPYMKEPGDQELVLFRCALIPVLGAAGRDAHRMSSIGVPRRRRTSRTSTMRRLILRSTVWSRWIRWQSRRI
jgi:hypothetical protein